MKLKLGKLLLKGFHKKRAGKPARKLQFKKTPSRKARTKTGIRFRKISRAKVPDSKKVPTKRTPAPPSLLARAQTQVTPQAAPQALAVVSQLQPQARFQDQTQQSLVAAELIRPGDRLRQSIEGFLLDQRSEHTRRAYGKDLKRFIRFLVGRGTRLEQLDRSILIAYKDSLLAEGLEHTTIDRHLATLRSFFRWLVDDGHLTRNPAEGVRFLNPKRLSKTLGFTDLEVTRLLKLPNLHTRTGAQHYAILMVLFYCGLRRSEICGIRTSHLSIERGHHLLRLKGKGNAERVIVLIDPVWNALLHYFKITLKNPARDQYLFSPIRNNRTGIKDKALDPSMIFYIVTRYAREAGITHRVSPHSCRATAISNARDHNVPDRAIQEFAGWASPDMITRYDKRKSAIEKSAAHAISYGSEARAMPWVRTEEVVLPEKKTPDRDFEPETGL